MSSGKYYVYILFRLDGTPCYVGKGVGDRWLHHERKKTKNRILSGIISQAVQLGLELPKIKIRENLSEEAAFEIERAFINAIGRKDLGEGPLANFTDGGDGASAGRTLTRQHRMKISVGMRGYSPTEEHRNKLSASNLGKKHKWSEQGRIDFIESQVHNPGHTGHKHSEETKEKLRAARARQRDPWAVWRERGSMTTESVQKE